MMVDDGCMVDDEWDGRNLRGKKPSETELGWLGWYPKKWEGLCN